MINQLSVENYKSFKQAHFEFSNLTFFVGANSCGKSSITNLLLMLGQSLESSFNFDTILRLNGKNIGLGDDLNIVRNHDENNKVTISWSIEEGGKEFTQLSEEHIIDEYHHNFVVNQSAIRRFCRKVNNHEIYKKVQLLEEEAENIFYRDYENRTSSKVMKILKAQQSLINKILKLENGGELITVGRFQQYSTARLKDLITFIQTREFSSVRPNVLKLVLRYNSSSGEIELDQLSIRNKSNLSIFDFSFTTTGRVEINSDVIDGNVLNKSRRDIIKGINKNSILLTDAVNSYRDIKSYHNPFAAYCLQYISGSTDRLCKQLLAGKIYHVSPLRALPQRYYLLEKSAHHETINSYNGTEVTEVLKNNPKVLQAVNEFFQEFNISIQPIKVRDVIHKITIMQGDISVDLTDVGFGISQVLPILVQLFLCEEGSTIIIEQPEIHLHPNMQAILTTLFVKISLKYNKKLIIETHSEAMIRRIQKLYLDPESNLTNDDVRIYQFMKIEDGSSEASCDTLGPLGEVKWMKGFKDIEILDTLEIQRLRSLKISRGNDFE